MLISFEVNKSFLKFLTDFGPLAIFFFYYYSNEKDLTVAIPPLIVATLMALIIVWIIEKKNSSNAFGKRNFNHFFWRIDYLF